MVTLVLSIPCTRALAVWPRHRTVCIVEQRLDRAGAGIGCGGGTTLRLSRSAPLANHGHPAALALHPKAHAQRARYAQAKCHWQMGLAGGGLSHRGTILGASRALLAQRAS